MTTSPSISASRLKRLPAFAAVMLFLFAPQVLAHQSPTPLRPLQGGEVAEIDAVRLEWRACPPRLTLQVRNRQDVPLRLRAAQVRAWLDTGLQTVAMTLDGASASGELPAQAKRLMLRLTLDDGRERRSMLALSSPEACTRTDKQMDQNAVYSNSQLYAKSLATWLPANYP